MRDVAITGVAMTKFGRYPDRSVYQLAAEASTQALKDAGAAVRDLELIVCGNLLHQVSTPGSRWRRRSARRVCQSLT